MNIEADNVQKLRVKKVPEQYANVMQSLFHISTAYCVLDTNHHMWNCIRKANSFIVTNGTNELLKTGKFHMCEDYVEGHAN